MSTPKKEIADRKRGVGGMADKEKLDDIILKKCIQDAYGLSKEEQLLKEMEEAGQSLDDAEFPGAGERMFKRIMEMEAAEKAANKAGLPSADEIAANAAIAASARTVSSVGNAANVEIAASAGVAAGAETAINAETVSSAGNAANAEVAASAGAAGNVETTGAKIVRFRRKKLIAVAALVAVLVGVLGVTAIGEKNYFFRDRMKPGYNVVFNNDNNKKDSSTLEQAYMQIEELGIPALRLGYLPTELVYESMDISGDNAIIIFDYRGNKIHFKQEEQGISASRNTKSDREEEITVYNKWLKKDIIIKYNILEEKVECGTEVAIKKNVYRMSGIMDKDEFKKVVENLYFLD